MSARPNSPRPCIGPQSCEAGPCCSPRSSRRHGQSEAARRPAQPGRSSRRRHASSRAASSTACWRISRCSGGTPNASAVIGGSIPPGSAGPSVARTRRACETRPPACRVAAAGPTHGPSGRWRRTSSVSRSFGRSCRGVVRLPQVGEPRFVRGRGPSRFLVSGTGQPSTRAAEDKSTGLEVPQ